MELKIKEIQELKPIDFNYEELKKELSNSLAKYKGLVVTEAAINEAKLDRANLNKLLKAINDRKIEVKKAFNVPYDEFETKIKELMSMIKGPVLEIDGQIKEFEIQKKDEKKRDVEEVFSALCKDDRIEFDRLFDEKWLNAGFSIKKVREELSEKLQKINDGFEAIKELGSDFEITLERIYLKRFDVGEVVKENARLNKDKEQAAAKKAEAVPAPEVVKKVEMGVAEKAALKPETEETRTIDFRVWATNTQLAGLKEYLTDHNIKFGKVV